MEAVAAAGSEQAAGSGAWVPAPRHVALRQAQPVGPGSQLLGLGCRCGLTALVASRCSPVQPLQHRTKLSREVASHDLRNMAEVSTCSLC